MNRPCNPFYAVVNERPMRALNRTPFVIVGEHQAPDREAIYKDKSEAVEQRDLLREEFGNSDLNVYKITAERIEEDEPE